MQVSTKSHFQYNLNRCSFKNWMLGSVGLGIKGKRIVELIGFWNYLFTSNNVKVKIIVYLNIYCLLVTLIALYFISLS